MTTTDKTLQVLDRALLVAEMAASLNARAAKVNRLLATLQAENRQPTDDELASVQADYETTRAKLLSDAALIDQVNGTTPATAG